MNNLSLVLLCVSLVGMVSIKFFDLSSLLFKRTSNKYVCLYAYYEKNDQYKENLKIFLETAILDNVDYYIIINGDCTLELPKKNNINIIYRENIVYDFGAWSYCINKYLSKEYDYYIFINGSVRGPYISSDKNWLDEFLKLFNSPEVKLVGTSINMLSNSTSYFGSEYLFNLYNKEPPYTHIQSMFFILDNEGFNYLLKQDFFNEKIINKYSIKKVITNKEINLSQLILNNNWNINCILDKYKNKDYRKIKENFNTHGDDPYFTNTYFGETIKPEEVIFFKINRF